MDNEEAKKVYHKLSVYRKSDPIILTVCIFAAMIISFLMMHSGVRGTEIIMFILEPFCWPTYWF